MLCVLLIGRKKEKKKERNSWGSFFSPKARHTLLALPSGIFTAVRCNYRLI
jgi:hypothetical protein